MTSPKQVLRQYKAKKRHCQPKPSGNLNSINATLMTLATIGLFAVAVGQVYYAHQQTKAAGTLAHLEVAKARPRVSISPSQDLVQFGGDDPGSYVELPEQFSIKLVSGIDTIFTIDAPITLHVSDDGGATSCYIEVRGLYLQDEQREHLDLFSPPREDFSALVQEFSEQGIEFNYPVWEFVVRYYDLYGVLKTEYLGQRLEQGAPPQKGLILYNGIWSGGSGFYYDELPEKWCPSISEKLERIITEMGGAPGNMGQPSEKPK